MYILVFVVDGILDLDGIYGRFYGFWELKIVVEVFVIRVKIFLIGDCRD